MNYTRLMWPSCRHSSVKTQCQLDCFSKTVMELAAVPKSQKIILYMPEFWEFFALLCIFWISQSGIWTIQDPICFDLLGKDVFYFKICFLVVCTLNQLIKTCFTFFLKMISGQPSAIAFVYCFKMVG